MMYDPSPACLACLDSKSNWQSVPFPFSLLVLDQAIGKTTITAKL